MLPCEVVRGQGRQVVSKTKACCGRQTSCMAASLQAVGHTLAEDIESLKMFSYYYFKIHYAMEEFLGKDMNYLVV